MRKPEYLAKTQLAVKQRRAVWGVGSVEQTARCNGSGRGLEGAPYLAVPGALGGGCLWGVVFFFFLVFCFFVFFFVLYWVFIGLYMLLSSVFLPRSVLSTLKGVFCFFFVE